MHTCTQRADGVRRFKCTARLQIMESLGGDNAWIDRFVAQHSAIVYFWGVMVLYALSPKHAYQFSELVEGHATDTYEGACHARAARAVQCQRRLSLLRRPTLVRPPVLSWPMPMPSIAVQCSRRRTKSC